MRHVSRFSNYLLLFKSAKKNQLCGEGSIWYLYSSKAIKNIYSFNPKSKIIIMLRNPGEMVYSLHYQKIFSLDENIKNFNDAWKASWLREKNKCVPKNCREKKTLFYHKVADYHKQLMNVYKYFPKKQVKIILYDEFKKNNLKIYKDVLKFLNLKYDGRLLFNKINLAKSDRFPLIGIFLKKPPEFIIKIGKLLKKHFGSKVNDYHHLLIQLNTKNENSRIVNPDTKKLINHHYEKSIIKLSILLKNEKLRNWLV